MTSSRQRFAEASTPRRAAVLGSPIAHSLSPALHRAAYAALGLTDWRYDAIECDVEALPGVLASCGPDVVGLSCTMPLKHAALAAARTVSPAAAAVGAANTLLPVDGGWHADNTDVDGVIGALAEAGLPTPPSGDLSAEWRGRNSPLAPEVATRLPDGGAEVDATPFRSALILGAGGTAQAVIVALGKLGVPHVAVAARDPEKATRALAPTGATMVDVVSFPDRLDPVEFDLIVSTLPGDAAAPLAAAIEAAGPLRRPVLLDVSYAPWPTTLAATAEAAGWAVVGGRAMLLHQAARQVELMTGRSAPIAAMRVALD